MFIYYRQIMAKKWQLAAEQQTARSNQQIESTVADTDTKIR